MAAGNQRWLKIAASVIFCNEHCSTYSLRRLRFNYETVLKGGGGVEGMEGEEVGVQAQGLCL